MKLPHRLPLVLLYAAHQPDRAVDWASVVVRSESRALLPASFAPRSYSVPLVMRHSHVYPAPSGTNAIAISGIGMSSERPRILRSFRIPISVLGECLALNFANMLLNNELGRFGDEVVLEVTGCFPLPYARKTLKFHRTWQGIQP